MVGLFRVVFVFPNPRIINIDVSLDPACEKIIPRKREEGKVSMVLWLVKCLTPELHGAVAEDATRAYQLSCSRCSPDISEAVIHAGDCSNRG